MNTVVKYYFVYEVEILRNYQYIAVYNILKRKVVTYLKKCSYNINEFSKYVLLSLIRSALEELNIVEGGIMFNDSIFDKLLELGYLSPITCGKFYKILV